MDKKTEQSRIRYNLLAHEYEDSFDGRFTLPYNEYICEHVKLHDGDSVLDVACGNGRLLRMLSKKAHINACGVDISEEMVRWAQNLNAKGDFRVSPADRIDFPDGTFNYVTVCCAFHHFIRPDAFMKEALRVLKKGGRLVIADPAPAAFVRWVENLIIPRMKMGDVRLYKDSELYKFYNDAGFTGVSYEKRNGMVIIEGIKT